jgi:hypothetical protein
LQNLRYLGRLININISVQFSATDVDLVVGVVSVIALHQVAKNLGAGGTIFLV